MNHSQLPRQRKHRAFTRRIRQLRRRATHKRNHTRRIDHTRLLLSMFPEAQHSILTSKPDALNINRLCQVPDLFWSVHSVVVIGVHYACVIEQDIAATPGIEVFDHGFDITFFGDVCDFGFDTFGVWDYRLDLCSGFVEGWAGDVGKED